MGKEEVDLQTISEQSKSEYFQERTSLKHNPNLLRFPFPEIPSWFLLASKFEVHRPKDVQEPGSYILSGAFDYVLDHRVKIEIQTRLPCISIPYSARITNF